EMVVQVIGVQPQNVLVGAHRLGHFAGDGRFVVVGVVEADGEGFHRRLPGGGGQAENGAGVDTAGQVTADRHVGGEALLHGLEQVRAYALDVVLFHVIDGVVGFLREVHVPVLAFLDLQLPV